MQQEHEWLRGANVVKVSQSVLTEAELLSSEEGSVMVKKA
jgi:hypothetical protein